MVFGGRGNRRGGLSDAQAEAVCAAARALGTPEPRWMREGGGGGGGGGGARFSVAGRTRLLTAPALRRAVRPRPELVGPDTPPPPLLDAIGLASALGLQPPPELTRDFRLLRVLLVPRLYSTRELAGPRRGMCRREAFSEENESGEVAGARGDLIRALAIGEGVGAPVVTTATLDQWPVDFDEAWAVAMTNLRARLGPDSLEAMTPSPPQPPPHPPHPPAQRNPTGVMALNDARLPGSSGALSLGTLFPEAPVSLGVVFALPLVRMTLALPVEPGSGVTGLAALVQLTHSLAVDRRDRLSDQVYWWRRGGVVHLPMTTVVEERSRRVHLEAEGSVGELLRILGVVAEE